MDYIVKNTVGKLLNPDGYDAPVITAKAGIQSETLDPHLHEDDKPIKTMTPKDVSKIRILAALARFFWAPISFCSTGTATGMMHKWATGKNLPCIKHRAETGILPRQRRNAFS